MAAAIIVHYLLDDTGVLRIEIGGRLIEQQHLWVQGQQAQQRQPLPLTRRQPRYAPLQRLLIETQGLQLLSGIIIEFWKMVDDPFPPPLALGQQQAQLAPPARRRDCVRIDTVETHLPRMLIQIRQCP